MPDISLPDTPPPSFAELAQRAEIHRVQLWGATLTGLLGLSVGRRALDGLVMSTDAVFWPTFCLLAASLLGQAWLWWCLHRADRAGRLLTAPFAPVITVTDLVVPLAWHSPRGP